MGKNIHIRTAYLWEGGESGKNEDSLVLQQADTRVGKVFMAAVCDGVGGLCEGETASGYMAEMLVVWFYKELLPMAVKHKSCRRLYRSAVKMLYETEEQLKEYGKEKGIKLGTCVTVLFIIERHFYILHVGDSRIYKTKRKTKVLSKEDGDGRILKRCIGAGKWEKPQWKYGKIRGKTGFLVCTDGFYKKLSKEEIFVLSSPQCRQEKLLEKRMKEAGEQIKKRRMQDNASAISIVF